MRAPSASVVLRQNFHFVQLFLVAVGLDIGRLNSLLVVTHDESPIVQQGYCKEFDKLHLVIRNKLY